MKRVPVLKANSLPTGGQQLPLTHFRTNDYIILLYPISEGTRNVSLQLTLCRVEGGNPEGDLILRPLVTKVTNFNRSYTGTVGSVCSSSVESGSLVSKDDALKCILEAGYSDLLK